MTIMRAVMFLFMFTFTLIVMFVDLFKLVFVCISFFMFAHFLTFHVFFVSIRLFMFIFVVISDSTDPRPSAVHVKPFSTSVCN